MFTDEETEGQSVERQTQLGLAPEGRPGLEPRCPGSHCGSSVLCRSLSERGEAPGAGTRWGPAGPSATPLRLLLGPHPPRGADPPAQGPEHSPVQRPVRPVTCQGREEGENTPENMKGRHGEL